MALKGRGPTRAERDWMDAIADLGCIVCHLEMGFDTPAEIHHLDGKKKPGAHLRSIPLCPAHHRGGYSGEPCVSRHPYKAAFVERYGTEEYLLEQTRQRVDGAQEEDGLEW